jgi:hypothetical protein
MSRSLLAASLIAAVALAACSASPAEPAPSPSASPTTPSSPPTAAPVSTPEPSATPRPSATPPAASPDPAPADFTADEQYLYDGVVRGAIDCEPAAGSDDLPQKAIAGLECDSDDPAVARIGFYLFENDDDMLDAYVSRMNAEGVTLDSGNCRDGEHEGPYTPGDGLVASRNGCFINDEGYANYRATLPGVHVYIGILSRSDDMTYLEDFAWVGNQDTPGNPTLWGEPTQ